MKTLLTLSIALFISFTALAHDGAHKKTKTDSAKTESVMTQDAHHDYDAVGHSHDEQMD